jgi:hypothetical protein
VNVAAAFLNQSIYKIVDWHRYPHCVPDLTNEPYEAKLRLLPAIHSQFPRMAEMDRRLPAAGIMVLPMNRRDIADYLGLTMETVSRALSELHTRSVT